MSSHSTENAKDLLPVYRALSQRNEKQHQFVDCASISYTEMHIEAYSSNAANIQTSTMTWGTKPSKMKNLKVKNNLIDKVEPDKRMNNVI